MLTGLGIWSRKELKSKMPGIPGRWLLYSPIGEPIAGTRLFSFKVPLKDALCKRLEENKRFTPEILMKLCPKLGLVIDLTNTTRYYDCEVFRSKGVQYKKIACPGQVIPADKLLKEFFNIVDAFLVETNGSDLLVGVHCTHGLNRTGYFVCRYMTLRMGVEPQKAISAFEKARGHQMERLPYVQRILSGKNLEDEKIMQHSHTDSGDQSGSGTIDRNTHLNTRREHYREHYPAFSQPPPFLHLHPGSLVTESPLANLYNAYVSSSNSVQRGPSKTGNLNSGPKGHSPHQSHSRSKKRRKKKKKETVGKQPPVKHPDHSKSPSGICRDVGLFGSNSANSSVNKFGVPTGTFFPNALLNPRSEHSLERRSFSQPPPFREKHPSSIRLDSPLTNLYNECVSSTSSTYRGPPKSGGTGNRNAGYQGHSQDHRYSPHNRHHRRKYQKP